MTYFQLTANFTYFCLKLISEKCQKVFTSSRYDLRIDLIGQYLKFDYSVISFVSRKCRVSFALIVADLNCITWFIWLLKDILRSSKSEKTGTSKQWKIWHIIHTQASSETIHHLNAEVVLIYLTVNQTSWWKTET